MKTFVESSYVDEHYEFFYSEKPDFLATVRKYEKLFNLHLIADVEEDTLDGFVSMIPGDGGYYIVLSLYKDNKEPNEASPHRFRKAKLSKQNKEAIKNLTVQ